MRYYLTSLRVCCQAAEKELELGVRNFLWKLTTIRNGLIKVQKQGRDENTRSVSCFRKVVVKKDWKATLLLLPAVPSLIVVNSYTEKNYPCTASPYTHRYLVRNDAWQQNSCTLWLDTTHQTTALLAMIHRFIRTMLSSYTTRCRVFFNFSSALLLKCTTARVCCQVVRKGPKLEVKIFCVGWLQFGMACINTR